MDGTAALILMVSAMAVMVSCHQVCFIGSEYNPQSGIPSRWVLPYEDPCKCTALRLGGMCRPASSYRQGAPYYLDKLLLSEDSDEIQTYFNCSRLATAPTECSSQKSLGMEDGPIPDNKIRASSSATPAWEGRLNNDKAWVPRGLDVNPWIEVDLVERTVVTGAITQGHYYAYVKMYKVGYQTQPSSDYKHVKDGNGNIKVFIGNANGDIPVTNLFDESVVATVVRIEPTDWTPLFQLALRLELLGCH